MLSRVAQVMPATLLPIQQSLTAVQDVIYFGNALGPDTIKQAVGLTQGQATSGQTVMQLGYSERSTLCDRSSPRRRHPCSLYRWRQDSGVCVCCLSRKLSIRRSGTARPAYGAYLMMEKHRILLEVCATDATACALQNHFHTKYAIPRNRILIHPDNIADPVS